MSFYEINENEIEIIKGTAANFREREGARHSLRYILGDLGDIKEKYFILGFHLNEFANCEYYKDFGYDSMKDFCLANIPIEYSSLSRCMSVHKYTCERLEGKMYPLNMTNRMEDKYKQYGYSQLVEMVGMDEEEEKLCTPDMTVKEIRKLKNRIKEVKKTSAYKIPADKLKTLIAESDKTNSCDVATGENEKTDNCDVATTEKENNIVEETTSELSEKEIQGEIKNVITGLSEFDKKIYFETFIKNPSEFVLCMFKTRFGRDLEANARGKMLELKIPGYEVTIRISFKEIEETEE